MVNTESVVKKIINNRILLISVIIAGLTGIMNVFAFMIQRAEINLLCLFLEGILANAVLYDAVFYTAKKCKIPFSKHDFIAVICMIVVSFAIYLTLVTLRTSIYVWDYTTYYECMEHLINEYSVSSIKGLNEWFFSGMKSAYGCFLTIFIYPVYCFTSKSIQAFILSYFFACVVPVMMILYLFGMYLKQNFFEFQKDTLLKYLIALTVVMFPLLHSAAVQGQPDIFGLAFAGIIILLTLSYEFDNRDYIRWVLIFMTTVAIILTRRWYLFWVTGYYISYFSVLVIKKCMNKDKTELKRTIRNILIFGTSSVILGLMILKRMLQMMMASNYSDANSSWNTGGFPAEIVNQLEFLGIIVWIMVASGWIVGLIRKKFRYITVIVILTNIVSLVLFTKIQNMGHHQSLILFYGYFFGAVVTVCSLYASRHQLLSLIPAAAITVSMVNCTCIDIQNQAVDTCLSKLDIYPHQRTDTEGLDKIKNYFDTHLNADEKVLILAGSKEYDSEVFANYPTVFSNSYYYRNNFLAPSGGFPTGFFEAAYIVTISPIQERDIVKNEKVLSTLVNEFENNEIIRNQFRQVLSIPLKEDVTAEIYKRVFPVNDKEADIFINDFAEYCQKYKELFYDRIMQYKE